MSNRRWTFKKHITLSAVITMISAISHYLYQLLSIMVAVLVSGDGADLFDGTVASIAIISGADGPTSIYTSLPLLLRNPAVEYIMLFLVLLLLYLPIKKALNSAFRT